MKTKVFSFLLVIVSFAALLYAAPLLYNVEMPRDKNDRSMQILGIKDGVAQHVAYTDTAGTSARIGQRVVTIWVSTDAYIKIGASPTATAADACLPAYTLMDIPIPEGYKISAIRVSADGTLHITERQ